MWQRLVFLLYYCVFKSLHRIKAPAPAPLEPGSFKKLLVFSAAGIGDALTDSPAIRAIKETYPGIKITVVAHKRRSCIARHNPYIDSVVEYHKGLFFFLYLWRTLRREKFDAVVVLRANDPDILPLAYLVKPDAVICNPERTRFGFLVSHPLSVPDWDKLHGVEQTLSVVRAVNAEARDKRLIYKVTEDEMRRIDALLSKSGADKTDIVAFQIGGGRRLNYRNWPWQNYARLAELLLSEYNVALLLLGGREYSNNGDKIAAELEGSALNLAGRLSLEETAAVLASSRILVTTDTGIMHLGFAVGVETLALLHYLHPAERVGPYGYGDKHTVLQLPMPEGSGIACLALLSPAEVYEKLCLLCRRQRIKRR